MQVGFVVFLSVLVLAALAALLGPTRPRWVGVSGAVLATGWNELPLVALALLAQSTWVAVTADDLLDAPAGWGLLAVAVGTMVIFVELLRRGWRARATVSQALAQTFGGTMRVGGTRATWRTLLSPFPIMPRKVQRLGNLSYGPAGRRNRLDVYRRRSGVHGAPVLVYLHGGGYFSGSKRREARAMLHRFAAKGWVCISASYRLRPQVQFPDHLFDAKRVLAWVREHGHELGADPTTLVMAGSSAGGHLTALAALTPNDPAFQPGFEDADTSVTAAVCLYAYYGVYYGRDPLERPSSSPLLHRATSAPPFFLAHGDRDSYVPVSGAQAMHRKLLTESSAPVVYAQLPGGQHAFDLFRSVRSEAVLAGIEEFTTRVLAPTPSRRQARAASGAPGPADALARTGGR
jgi:acetyl esterase/lipase